MNEKVVFGHVKGFVFVGGRQVVAPLIGDVVDERCGGSVELVGSGTVMVVCGGSHGMGLLG